MSVRETVKRPVVLSVFGRVAGFLLGGGAGGSGSEDVSGNSAMLKADGISYMLKADGLFYMKKAS